MKTASSLPDVVFEEVKALAQQLGLSRSQLYTKALQAYLKKYSQKQILHKLNQVMIKSPLNSIQFWQGCSLALCHARIGDASGRDLVIVLGTS